MADLSLQGTWFSAKYPYHGYLVILPYSEEYNAGDAVAIIHAHRGRNEPPIAHKGVWKPTREGWEVIAGPWHFKRVTMYMTPPTDNADEMQYVSGQLNGWGRSNLAKLTNEEEKKFVEGLTDLPEWQEEITYWKDYPTASFNSARKYLSHAGRLEPRDKRKGKMDKAGYGDAGKADSGKDSGKDSGEDKQQEQKKTTTEGAK